MGQLQLDWLEEAYIAWLKGTTTLFSECQVHLEINLDAVLPFAIQHSQPYVPLTFLYPHQLVFKPDYWPAEMDTQPHNLLTRAAPPPLPTSPPRLPLS